MFLAAAGMWKAQYWAVLGFEFFLGLTLVFAAVSLMFAGNVLGVDLQPGHPRRRRRAVLEARARHGPAPDAEAAGDMSWAHTHTERVRFGDLDAMKHLNNVVFLRYFETARIEHRFRTIRSTRELGTERRRYRSIYRSPAHFDEDVAIRVRPAEIGTKSLKLEFEMAVGERLIAEGHGILVGYDYESGETVPLPDALKERLR